MKQKFTKGKELHILDFKCVSFQLNKNGTSFIISMIGKLNIFIYKKQECCNKENFGIVLTFTSILLTCHRALYKDSAFCSCFFETRFM